MPTPPSAPPRLLRGIGAAALILAVAGSSGSGAARDAEPSPPPTEKTGQTGPADRTVTPTGRQRFLAEVVDHLGYREPGHGRTPYGRWYARKVADRSFATGAWCGMFLDYCAERAGVGRQVRGHAWTVAHARSFHADGRFDRRPRAGSIVFFDWDGSRRIEAIDHVGVVEEVLPDGRIRTLEGNTGDRVQRRERAMRTVVGFGHPRWR